MSAVRSDKYSSGTKQRGPIDLEAFDEFWVQEADRWDGTGGQFGDAMLDAADLKPGEQVLDVGCGAGSTTVEAGRQRSIHDCRHEGWLPRCKARVDHETDADGERRRGSRRLGRRDAAKQGSLRGSARGQDRISNRWSAEGVRSVRRSRRRRDGRDSLAPDGAQLIRGGVTQTRVSTPTTSCQQGERRWRLTTRLGLSTTASRKEA